VEKGDSGFADRLRSTLGAEQGKDVVIIFDLGSRKGYFSDITSLEGVTTASIRTFVERFLAEDPDLTSKEMSL